MRRGLRKSKEPDSHLPEVSSAWRHLCLLAGIGTLPGAFVRASRLSRHHRAGPSASLDKSAAYLVWSRYYTNSACMSRHIAVDQALHNDHIPPDPLKLPMFLIYPHFAKPNRPHQRPADHILEVGIYEKHGQLEGVWRDVVIVERLIDRNVS